jgi:hypothetical protein
MPLFASQPVKGRVVNAQGEPVTGCEIYGLNDRWGWQRKGVAEFVIDDLRPKEKRKIFAFHRTLGLVGGVIASHQAAQPLEIKLSPAGRITGQLVDKDGEPVTDAVLHSNYDKLHTDDHTGIWADHPTNVYDPSHIPVDAEGRFQLDGLTPGWTYSAYATASRKIDGQVLSNYVIGTLFDDLKIEPGEKKELGAVRLKQ